MSEKGDDTINSRELEEFTTLQLDRIKQLQRELINCKKDGADRKTRFHFKNRLKRIMEIRVEFMKTHREIILLNLSEDDPYTKEEILDQFENEYVDIISCVEAEYDKYFPESLTSTSTASPTNTNPQNFTLQVSPQSELPFKLPQITIPHFSGVYTEWPSFYDSFLQYHNHEKLNNSHKFQYLKIALSPKVKSLIGYLDITAENYEVAWKALIARYNNKRVLFSNHMEQFICQPTISNETAEELQTLHDISRACVFSLEKLGIKTNECGELLAHILIKKLPHNTRLEWEKHLGKAIEIPKFEQLIEFIDLRFRTLEAMYPQSSVVQSQPNNSQSKQSSQSTNKHQANNRKESKSFHVSAKAFACPRCGQSHVLRKCPSFLQLSAHERKIFADKVKLCINCLGHSNNQNCISTKTCFTCGGRHHTLLHFNKSNASPSQSNHLTASSSQIVQSTDGIKTNSNDNIQLVSNNLIRAKSHCVLLTTALVDIPDINGQLVRLRALVDQCSQHSIITERAAQLLKLPITPICVGVRPMGETQYKIVNKGLIVNIHSTIDSLFRCETLVAIIPNITSKLPLSPLKQKSWPHIQSLPLADPHFASPGQIDLLLGGEVYYQIMQNGLCKGQLGEPMAQQTSLGWILSGEVTNQNHVTAISAECFHVSTVQIGEYIKKFHELEEVSDFRELSNEDEWTVDHYNRTYQRQPNGKFMVRLPFKNLYDPSIQLGSSFSMALKRFQSLQRRFHRDSNFHTEYTKIIDEYKQLNQIKSVDTINDDFYEPDAIKHFYLPHHAVFKASSLTTKLRTVFDGSAKSSNGNSLNDILTTGPSLQSDLISIILNWRTHKFVIIADIEKMYRCIDVHPDDANYQLILWEENSKIKSYALQTVTFGIKTSPYLAIQTMQKLAELERDQYPLAYTSIKHETYVDDVTTGSETIKQTIELTNQLIHMLRNGGFELRKWASNSAEILDHIPCEYREQNTNCLFNISDEIKALGLSWSTTDDCFHFNINFSVSHSHHTKRTTLSIIARLFDPLGWLNPFITKAKLFLNKLWEANLEWDVNLPSDLDKEWKEILNQFQFINRIKLPRWLHTTSKNKQNELHVFCDSSQKAYATVIYLRTIDSSDNIHVNILIAKSKLTPIRKPITIPRAELCGAVLAVKLLDFVKLNLRLKIHQTYLWTDSSIVLSWIRGDPNRWAVFVSNRINKILKSTDIEQWRHVVSKDNAADCNSRGLSIEQLSETDIWWSGPVWLSLPSDQWPSSPFNIINDDPNELRAKFKSVNLMVNELSSLDSTLIRFSNFNRLRFCFAYVLRFITKLRESVKLKKPKTSILTHSKNHIVQLINTVPIATVAEIEKAENTIIRLVQKEHFASEINALNNNKHILKSSKLFRLNPFIDSNGLLRVNGRLRNAQMTYNEKYPLIIPSKNRIVNLIVDFYHRQTQHGGPLITVNQIRQNYWILNVRNFARHFIYKCNVCFKNKPVLSKQQMGALPFARVNDKSRPFASTIIDYAGPYDIRASKGRGQKSYKGYVAVFTCMATKAVHLEAAGDLSTQTFLHAFERFVARRGLCHDIFSDNGTNFVGASNDFKRTQKEFEETVSKEILPYMTTRNIQWHFSPPGAPHFNGLAEAAVKSMKYHLARIIGEAKLTFEEFSTVLTRIESVLNSRPISPCSDNPNDFTALTPGHFLIGNALLSRPQPLVEENPTKRYQLMEKMVQHFWQRFRSDILSSMQIRTKWQDKQPNLKENDLVIIKDERFPVNQWPMGRVTQLHRGSDDLIRVVSVQTSHGMYKRPITKLCVVPTQHDI